MAAGAEEKTEEPTAKRKSDARKRGNIPKSRDLTAALELLGAIYILRYIGPAMAGYMESFMLKMLGHDFGGLPIPEGKEIVAHAGDWGKWLALILTPFLILACVIALAVNVLQVGLNVSFESVKLNLGKLNPVSGVKRLFSARNLVHLLMNLGKLALVIPVAWWVINLEFRNILPLLEMGTGGILVHLVDRTLGLARNLALLLLALGLADYYYQKRKHNNELKMTKQEVKEEFKQMEGSPEVKSKIRQKQREAAQRRMMAEVPQAEVVVRNPTHFAVAISYKPDMPAPMVVAKGKDRLALRIIEIAEAAGVPIWSDPPLARELHKKVEIGEDIPAELYAAVAEVFSVVFSPEKKRRLMEASAA
ncbi:MAG: flagellar biosynthesis protein FlhB [Planctomycetota bacterium]|jgi:flagellar biosynthetic protein FlhB|nr:flagellar biosynthesis protein FlhB [Planctomycetota bacterium]MDR1520144.1 flagellar biosynthesis protein FlhB [Planctomycetota bacterium]